MPPPEHRADAVFVLPRLPVTAAVIGELPGWSEDLRERGIEVIGSGEGPDLVVAEPTRAGEAAALGAPSLIVDGTARIDRSSRRRYDASSRLLPLPVAGSPMLFVDLGQRRAARYGIEHGIVHTQRWRTLRNRAAARSAGLGLLPEPRGAIGVAASDGPPAFLSAAREAGAIPDAEWLMLVSSGSIIRRNAFLLFPPGSRTPAQVLKFSRVPGVTAQFDRDERAAVLVAETGGSVARHAPSYLGRVELDGRTGSLETAAVGTKLTNFLRQPRPRDSKLRAVEAVARWLVEVARETAAPPEALAEERGRLEREVLPAWSELGVSQGLVQRIPPVPATFQHNDVAEENVVYSHGDFTVLDWEWAQPHGLPLGDLIYFAVHVLRIIDGAATEDARDRHFVDVMTGRAPSSAVLFRWVRQLVDALGLTAEAVGPLVTANWLDRGSLSLAEHRRAEEVGGRQLDPSFAERVSRTWVQHPELGPGWAAWR